MRLWFLIPDLKETLCAVTLGKVILLLLTHYSEVVGEPK